MLIRPLLIFTFLLLLLSGYCPGQKPSIRWTVEHPGLQMEVLRFYITDIILYKEHKEVCKDANPRLIDLSEGSVNQPLPASCTSDFNRISFELGIDSATNVRGVMGGDLDPTTGMYWTWQSGYINFKLEATLDDGNGLKQELQYHLGGYRQPYNSRRKIQLSINPAAPTITFYANRFLEAVPDSIPHHVISPGINACILSDGAAAAFSTEKQ